jgi:hypothetical protein
MKVLKEGKWNVPWTTTAVCKTCEAEALIEEADVKPTFDKDGKFYWVCVVCGKSNDLPSKEIAQRVCEAVAKKRKYSWGWGD